MKRKKDYEQHDVVNFYDVKKGRRDTINERVKDQIHQSFRYVFENASSPDFAARKNSKVQSGTFELPSLALKQNSKLLSKSLKSGDGTTI